MNSMSYTFFHNHIFPSSLVMAVFTLLCVYILYLNDLLLFCQPYNQCFNKIIMHTYLSLLSLIYFPRAVMTASSVCMCIFSKKAYAK